MLDSKILIDSLRSKVIESEQKVQTLQEEKKKIADVIHKNPKNKDEDDRFEDVLRDEFQNMQIGFEMKIENLTEALTNFKKEKGREILDIKQQMAREIETKNLLMKKLSAFINY